MSAGRVGSAHETRISVGSAQYSPENLLDRHTSAAARAYHDAWVVEREQVVFARFVGLGGGDVLSVGCGWNPGRHLFPAPAFRLVGADADGAKVGAILDVGRIDEGIVGEAGRLTDLPDGSFDAVLYRLVLHHIAYQGPLQPCFAEAYRLLRPGGVLVAIEPGLWHPIGAALAIANAAGLAASIHGTPDDVPLSPLALLRLARGAGLAAELHALTYSWRRLPPAVQRGLRPLDALGSRPRAALAGHTLMLIARRSGGG